MDTLELELKTLGVSGSASLSIMCDLREYRSCAEHSTNTAIAVLASMTSLHKFEAGMLKPTLRAECLAEVVEEARVVVAPQLQPSVALRVNLDTAARDGIFECDRLWLAQILINLGQATLSK